MLRWICLAAHGIGVVTWIGGLVYQSMILIPTIGNPDPPVKRLLRVMNRRFLLVIWSGVAIVLFSGIGLMLLHPEFGWFRWTDRASALIALKHLTFLLMTLYATGYTQMLLYLDSPSVNGGYDERVALYQRRIVQFERISMILGLCAIIFSMGLLV